MEDQDDNIAIKREGEMIELFQRVKVLSIFVFEDFREEHSCYAAQYKSEGRREAKTTATTAHHYAQTDAHKATATARTV